MKKETESARKASVNDRGRSVLPRQKTQEKSIRPYVRMLFVILIFLTVAVLYSVFLIRTVLDYREETLRQEETYSEKTVTVQAVRGEIFDRNGKPLIRNQYN